MKKIGGTSKGALSGTEGGDEGSKGEVIETKASCFIHAK